MKILILEANPRKDLDLSEEIRSLRRVFDDVEDRGKFEIRDGAAVSKREIQKWMLDFEAKEPKDDQIIVHFCGHGTGLDGLVFEDHQGNSDLIDTEILVDLFVLFKDRIACIVMNACYSEVQADAISEHIKYVIGMNQAIRDDAAIAFSTGFYQALSYEKTFEDAFKFGTNAIQLAIDDNSKDKRNISEEMRKLMAKSEASESIITQEHLKPILKIRADLIASSSEDTIRKDNLIKPEEKNLNTNFSTLEYPTGKVSLDSKFYIQRKIDLKAFESFESTGEFIRIKAPQQMGKSSFLSRLLNYAEQEYGYKIISINLAQPEAKFFENIDDLLGLIYQIINDQLALEFNKNDWKESVDSFGANYTWNKFFRKHILKSDQHLVLAFDNFDRVFKYPQIAADFCGLLRSLYSQDRDCDFFLIVAYSQESYVVQGINQSPFENIGIPIELPEFNFLEVKKLVQIHQIKWNDQEIKQLMSIVGGHPYLIRVALYEIADQKTSLSKLLETAWQINGCYYSYLSKFQEMLDNEDITLIAFEKVVNANKPIRVEDSEALKLYRMGLIIPVDGGKVRIRCKLYQEYFLKHLTVN